MAPQAESRRGADLLVVPVATTTSSSMDSEIDAGGSASQLKMLAPVFTNRTGQSVDDEDDDCDDDVDCVVISSGGKRQEVVFYDDAVVVPVSPSTLEATSFVESRSPSSHGEEEKATVETRGAEPQDEEEEEEEEGEEDDGENSKINFGDDDDSVELLVHKGIGVSFMSSMSANSSDTDIIDQGDDEEKDEEQEKDTLVDLPHSATGMSSVDLIIDQTEMGTIEYNVVQSKASVASLVSAESKVQEDSTVEPEIEEAPVMFTEKVYTKAVPKKNIVMELREMPDQEDAINLTSATKQDDKAIPEVKSEKEAQKASLQVVKPPKDEQEPEQSPQSTTTTPLENRPPLPARKRSFKPFRRKKQPHHHHQQQKLRRPSLTSVMEESGSASGNSSVTVSPAEAAAPVEKAAAFPKSRTRSFSFFKNQRSAKLSETNVATALEIHTMLSVSSKVENKDLPAHSKVTKLPSAKKEATAISKESLVPAVAPEIGNELTPEQQDEERSNALENDEQRSLTVNPPETTPLTAVDLDVSFSLSESEPVSLLIPSPSKLTNAMNSKKLKRKRPRSKNFMLRLVGSKDGRERKVVKKETKKAVANIVKEVESASSLVPKKRHSTSDRAVAVIPTITKEEQPQQESEQEVVASVDKKEKDEVSFSDLSVAWSAANLWKPLVGLASTASCAALSGPCQSETTKDPQATEEPVASSNRKTKVDQEAHFDRNPGMVDGITKDHTATGVARVDTIEEQEVAWIELPTCSSGPKQLARWVNGLEDSAANILFDALNQTGSHRCLGCVGGNGDGDDFDISSIPSYIDLHSHLSNSMSFDDTIVNPPTLSARRSLPVKTFYKSENATKARPMQVVASTKRMGAPKMPVKTKVRRQPSSQRVPSASSPSSAIEVVAEIPLQPTPLSYNQQLTTKQKKKKIFKWLLKMNKK